MFRAILQTGANILAVSVVIYAMLLIVQTAVDVANEVSTLLGIVVLVSGTTACFLVLGLVFHLNKGEDR